MESPLISAHDGFPRWVDSSADFIEIDIRRDRRGVTIHSHDEPLVGVRYPTFDEILEAAAGRIGLHLDLKERGYEVELIGRALERFPVDRIVATPDVEDSTRTIKANFPDVRVSPIDFVTVDQQSATDKSIQSSKLPVWIWTVDKRKLMQRFLADPRIECLITNRPDLALRLRSRKS